MRCRVPIVRVRCLAFNGSKDPATTLANQSTHTSRNKLCLENTETRADLPTRRVLLSDSRRRLNLSAVARLWLAPYNKSTREERGKKVDRSYRKTPLLRMFVQNGLCKQLLSGRHKGDDTQLRDCRAIQIRVVIAVSGASEMATWTRRWRGGGRSSMVLVRAHCGLSSCIGLST